ncbi:MAG: serine/threonine protein kinase [Planctomycetales bacterium]|nr:serine/threonine protein kinase [Planctomycetales bacterium]
MAAYHYQQGDRPLDGYTIQHALGRGGFGEVYFAISDAGREVALKSVLNFEDIELRGIGHCMNLKSPHLVMIFDVKQGDDGTPWVIMEYVSGPSLRQILDESPGGLPPQQATFFLQELAKGIDCLHEAGIVHRDLKPHNVFFEDGRVKIGDYSLSKVMTVSHASGHTMTVGSVHYMAPEISMGKYDKTVDLYAMGVMLFEMLTGKPPFVGESVGEVLMKHLNGKLDVSGLSKPFADVVQKAMDRDPAKRFQSAREMAAALVSSSDAAQAADDWAPASLSLVGRGSTAEQRGGQTATIKTSEMDRLDENDLADTVVPNLAMGDTAKSPRHNQTRLAIDLFGEIDRRTANIRYQVAVTLSFFTTNLLMWLAICLSPEIFGSPTIPEFTILSLGVWLFSMAAVIGLVLIIPQQLSFRNGIASRAWLLAVLGVTYLIADYVVDATLGHRIVVGCLVGTAVAMMILDWLHFTKPQRAERISIFRTLIAGGISVAGSAPYFEDFDFSTLAMASTMASAITVQLAAPWIGPDTNSQEHPANSSKTNDVTPPHDNDRSHSSLSVSTPTVEPVAQ